MASIETLKVPFKSFKITLHGKPITFSGDWLESVVWGAELDREAA